MTPTTVLVQITPTTCCNCGVVFGIEAMHRQSLVSTGAWFYCPNGHRQHFTETEADRLRKQLEQKERQLGFARARADSVQDQYDAERRQHAATKGQLTKTRKRVAAGVCPCCHRSFTNLQRHMAGQHPDFAAEADRDRD